MIKPESEYNMFDWWKKAMFYNYASFSGRARRSEYWYFVLVNCILSIPIYFMGIIGESYEVSILSSLVFGAFGLFLLGLIIPSLAVTVRRLHDQNKSGWYYFIVLIPFGSIVLLIWMCAEGNPYRNIYGVDPKNPVMPEFDFDQNLPG